MFSIYGTPAWANHDKGQNVAPLDPSALRAFAYAAALRYSGTYVADGKKLPKVRDWLAWNEPNNPVFLKPQYRRDGRKWVMLSAINYAKICNAVYNGVHGTGLTQERVACGATAPRGNNNPSSSRPSVSPLAFLRAVKADGLVTFDAWAHHPYYGKPSETPATPDGAGESVELGNLNTLIRLVTKLYGNKRIWITEYGYETNPPDSLFGVSYAKQAAYLKQAFAIARGEPAHGHDALVPAEGRHEHQRLAVGPDHGSREEEAVLHRVRGDGVERLSVSRRGRRASVPAWTATARNC